MPFPNATAMSAGGSVSNLPDRHQVRAEQPTDLVADGTTDTGRLNALRHQRRHPPERRLLVCDPRELSLRRRQPARGRRDPSRLRAP